MWRSALILLLLAGCLEPQHRGGSVPTTTPRPGVASASLGPWTYGAPDPLPRYEIGFAQVGPRLYEIAGLRGGAVATTTVEVYDAENDSWASLPEYPWPAHHHGAAAVDGTVYSFGGWIGLGSASSTLAFRHSPIANAWLPVRDLPQQRGAHSALNVDGKIWLIGGTGANSRLIADIDIYDPKTDSYSEGPKVPVARDHLAALYLDGEVYVVGGRERTLATTSPDVHIYNLTAQAWRKGPSTLLAHGGFAAVAYHGALIAIGGELAETPRLRDKTEILLPGADAWQPLPALQSPRTGLGAGLWKDRVFAFSGASPGGQPLSDRPESIDVKPLFA